MIHGSRESRDGDEPEEPPAEPSLSSSGESPPSEESGGIDVGIDFRAGLSHITSSNVNLAAGDITIIQVGSAADTRGIMQTLKEESSIHHIPKPPPPDAPLQSRVDHWFENELKTDREKLFAITLSLFNGIKYPDFKAIYELVLRTMKVDEAGEEEKPPSRFGSPYDILIHQVEARMFSSDDGLEQILKFQDEHFSPAIFDLLRRRHPDILLDLLPALKLIVEQYRYWQIRSRAALAVAEIGKLGFQMTRSQVLEPWARDQRAYVRAAVGYPLARLAEDKTYRSAVQSMLGDWTDEHWTGPGLVWRYRWTAASTYKQIGSTDLEWGKNVAYGGLKKIAGFDDIRLADSVIHSLVVLSLRGQLDRVLLVVKEWVEDITEDDEEQTSQIRCLVGILAFVVLAQVHVELVPEDREKAREADAQVGNLFELVCQGESEGSDIWQLAVLVGLQAFEWRMPDIFFNLIAHWTEQADDSMASTTAISNLLAEVYSLVNRLRQEHIWNRLGRWECQTKDERLAKMATLAKSQIQGLSLGKLVISPPQKRRIALHRKKTIVLHD